LNGARIGRGSVVAAGALVRKNDRAARIDGYGVPAKVRRQVTAEERERFSQNSQRYIRYRQQYRDDPVS